MTPPASPEEETPLIDLFRDKLGPIMVMSAAVKMIQEEPYQLGYSQGYSDAKEGKPKKEFPKTTQI